MTWKLNELGHLVLAVSDTVNLSIEPEDDKFLLSLNTQGEGVLMAVCGSQEAARHKAASLLTGWAMVAQNAL